MQNCAEMYDDIYMTNISSEVYINSLKQREEENIKPVALQ
jgi:hypothetical protein